MGVEMESKDIFLSYILIISSSYQSKIKYICSLDTQNKIHNQKVYLVIEMRFPQCLSFVLGILTTSSCVTGLSWPRTNAALPTIETPDEVVYVCCNKACRRAGAHETVRRVTDLSSNFGIRTVSSGCIGRCGSGPNIKCGGRPEDFQSGKVRIPASVQATTMSSISSSPLLISSLSLLPPLGLRF
jgi:hypothetical protein